MQVTLNVNERMILSSLIGPRAGDVMLLKVIRETREQLSFTDEEIDQWAEGGERLLPCRITKDCERRPDNCCHRDKWFTLSKRVVKIVVDELTRRNEAKQLSLDLYTLAEKFCPKLFVIREEDTENVDGEPV